MRGAKKAAFATVNELVGTLTHSRVPTIVVEGGDDVIVYRRIEEEFASVGLSILPVGGRNNVLEIFERRAEIPSGIAVMFVADRDLWVHSDIPAIYVSRSLAFTQGYSIENDMFCDGELELLLTLTEQKAFLQDIARFCEWYALASSRCLAGKSEAIDQHPNRVLDDPSRFEALITLANGEIYPFAFLAKLRAEYRVLIRGKSLFGVLQRHKKGYASATLLNIGAARRGPCYQAIVERVKSQLQSRATALDTGLPRL